MIPEIENLMYSSAEKILTLTRLGFTTKVAVMLLSSVSLEQGIYSYRREISVLHSVI